MWHINEPVLQLRNTHFSSHIRRFERELVCEALRCKCKQTPAPDESWSEGEDRRGRGTDLRRDGTSRSRPELRGDTEGLQHFPGMLLGPRRDKGHWPHAERGKRYLERVG